MGILKKITGEYFGDNMREEDFIDTSGLNVEIVSFTDMNGKFHGHGYRVVEDNDYERTWTLKQLLERIIKQNGNKCSLNCVDVSNIKYMIAGAVTGMFEKSDFDGDISGWDVSNVENMDGMFANSKFTGENGIFKLPEGNVVTNMKDMFFGSMFNSDISDWDVSNVTNMYRMFKCSSFSYDISGWNVNEECSFKEMFEDSPLEGNEPEWYKKWYEKIKGTIWEC